MFYFSEQRVTTLKCPSADCANLHLFSALFLTFGENTEEKLHKFKGWTKQDTCLHCFHTGWLWQKKVVLCEENNLRFLERLMVAVVSTCLSWIWRVFFQCYGDESDQLEKGKPWLCALRCSVRDLLFSQSGKMTIDNWNCGWISCQKRIESNCTGLSLFSS